jgi:hypothetical protein
MHPEKPTARWIAARDRVADDFKKQCDDGHGVATLGDVYFATGIFTLIETLGHERAAKHLLDTWLKVSDLKFKFAPIKSDARVPMPNIANTSTRCGGCRAPRGTHPASLRFESAGEPGHKPGTLTHDGDTL